MPPWGGGIGGSERPGEGRREAASGGRWPLGWSNPRSVSLRQPAVSSGVGRLFDEGRAEVAVKADRTVWAAGGRRPGRGSGQWSRLDRSEAPNGSRGVIMRCIGLEATKPLRRRSAVEEKSRRDGSGGGGRFLGPAAPVRARRNSLSMPMEAAEPRAPLRIPRRRVGPWTDSAARFSVGEDPPPCPHHAAAFDPLWTIHRSDAGEEREVDRGQTVSTGRARRRGGGADPRPPTTLGRPFASALPRIRHPTSLEPFFEMYHHVQLRRKLATTP